MLAVFAEFERDILRDRVKAGIAQARRPDLTAALASPPAAATGYARWIVARDTRRMRGRFDLRLTSREDPASFGEP